MSQIAVQVPQSAPQEPAYQNDSADPEAPKLKDDDDTDTDKIPEMKKKTSFKSAKESSTAVSESAHSSRDPWSSPFRTLSKSLIGFFITVLVIARIKAKPSDSSDGSIPNMGKGKKKKKKTVRILDKSGNLTIPAKNRDEPDAGASASDSHPLRKGKDDVKVKVENSRDQLDDTSEWKLVYKPLLIKTFVVLLLGAVAVVLWAVFTKQV
ncbi:MAG: hypothetical protein SGBAC_012783 [Bacillariaceae sp.]